jgi:hypothetical protein
LATPLAIRFVRPLRTGHSQMGGQKRIYVRGMPDDPGLDRMQGRIFYICLVDMRER